MEASEAKILEPVYSSKGPKSAFFGSRISENIFFAKKNLFHLFRYFTPKKTFMAKMVTHGWNPRYNSFKHFPFYN